MDQLGAPPKALRVLVIEDDRDQRLQLTTVFAAAGFAVHGAANGALGLEAFAAEPADLVVTDIIMPGLSGIEVIHALRGRSAAVMVIAISGDHDNLELARLVGADRTLQKPFRPSALVALASELLTAGNLKVV